MAQMVNSKEILTSRMNQADYRILGLKNKIQYLEQIIKEYVQTHTEESNTQEAPCNTWETHGNTPWKNKPSISRYG